MARTGIGIRRAVIGRGRSKVKDVPFEKKAEIIPLYLMFVIVDHHQGNFFLEGFEELGVALSLHLLGKGTAPEEVYDVLSTSTRKDIVIGVIKEPDLQMVSEFIQQRFAVSKKAKGVAFTAKINSMVGVLIYKFLTNSRDYNLKTDTKKEI